MKNIFFVCLILFTQKLYAQDTIRIKLNGTGNGGSLASGWTISGNSGTDASYNFIGTKDSTGLIFKTNNILSGNIDVSKSNIFFGRYAFISNTTGQYNTSIGTRSGYNNTSGNQNTYIGWNTGAGITTGSFNTIVGANVTGLSSSLTKNVIIADGQGNRRINVDSSGNVGIGTDDPKGYRLAVNGAAIFTKAKVSLYSSWPDYVFKPEYRLPTFSELENFINNHGRLPGVPSSSEVENDGIDLGNTQVILLEKIEELTLLSIQLNKKIEEMQQKIIELENKK